MTSATHPGRYCDRHATRRASCVRRRPLARQGQGDASCKRPAVHEISRVGNEVAGLVRERNALCFGAEPNHKRTHKVRKCDCTRSGRE